MPLFCVPTALHYKHFLRFQRTESESIENMATAEKRKHENQNDEYHSAQKKAKKDDILAQFISWCHGHEFQLSSKVAVSRDGSCAQYGMRATEDIAEGYCIFQVPRSTLLMPANSDIANSVDIENPKLTSTNQWIPLLLTLLYESNKADSKWDSYLTLAPDPEAIDLPMFWGRTEVDRLLKGTGVDKAVERDLKMIESDFTNMVLPYKQNLTGKNRDDAINLDTFKRMVAFVMAYSFTEPASKGKCCEGSACCGDSGEDDDDDEDNEESEEMKPPMMVPMADMLNHITNHNAKLTFGSEALKMVTTRAIKKGEEIFNTYGQVSNLHLMHMYGFAEPYPDNTNDVVEIPMNRLLEATKEMCTNENDSKLLESKWELLLKQDLIAEDDVLVLGVDGIINDDSCMQVLKVLCMSSSEYADYIEKEGWSDAESEGSDAETSILLDFSHLSSLDQTHKSILKRMGELHLEHYAISFQDAVKKMEVAASLPARERYALYTLHGQQMLIQQLMTACMG